jgi:hypothetical protein
MNYFRGAFTKMFDFFSFQTNLGESSPVRELPAVSTNEPNTPTLILSPTKETTVWYDPEGDQLYIFWSELRFLTTKTYSSVGAFKDISGARYYHGGTFEQMRNPRKLGLIKIGVL